MKKLISFIRQEKGGMAVLFALVLPFIISFCALAFDGARLMTKKARLADALNEAALAIATASTIAPNEEEQIKLETLLNNYIKTYLPNDPIVTSKININYTESAATGSNIPIFDIHAKVNVKTLLPMKDYPSFEPSLDIFNHGKVRKGNQSIGIATDYVFVLDFSSSMDFASAQPGMTRLELLKKVVHDITHKALDAFPESTFALVPFDTAVMVRYPDKNELGGYINGCSVLTVQKKITNAKLGEETGFDIDYAFWANKIIALRKLPHVSSTATSLPYTLDDVNLLIDTARYDYFETYVIPSLKRELGNSITWDYLVEIGWCKKNDPDEDIYRAPYSCEKDPNDSIFTPENQIKIRNEMERARRVAKSFNEHSLNNTTMTDVEATLDGMFDEANIITFPLIYWNTENYQRMMCKGGGVANVSGNNRLADVVPTTYLIEPTNDLAVLDEFQLMQAKGTTLSSAGLLRAVPEMLKGSNPRTVMIVISDGDDNTLPLFYGLHIRAKGDRICDRIREGVKARKPGTEDVDIYFISVVDDEDSAIRTKRWADYCTGADNAVIATNYEQLIDKLTEFMNGEEEETGYFTN